MPFPGGAAPTTGKKAKKRKAKKAKAPKKSKAKKAKAKKPCKYGPRDEEGYCPKKPRKNPWANAEDVILDEVVPKKKAAKKAKAPAKSAARKKLEKDVTRAAEKAAELALKKAAEKVKANPEWTSAAAGIAGTRVSQLGKLPKVAAVGALSGVLLAGIAAYAATTYIITKRARNKEEREQQAFEAAQAYRQSRVDAERQKGSKLTTAEQKALAAGFRDTLRSLKIPVPGSL